MAVYIKGMEMPENCIECPLRKGTVCDAFQLIQPYTFKDDERALFCPLTEVAEPKTGKWIRAHGYVTPGGDPVWECSECGKGRHVFGIEHGSYGADVADHQWVACPNCGAWMEE